LGAKNKEQGSKTTLEIKNTCFYLLFWSKDQRQNPKLKILVCRQAGEIRNKKTPVFTCFF